MGSRPVPVLARRTAWEALAAAERLAPAGAHLTDAALAREAELDPKTVRTIRRAAVAAGVWRWVHYPGGRRPGPRSRARR